MNTGKITVVVGAQFGSEGKGVVVHRMTQRRHYTHHVRVGGPNAGHSFIHEGEPYVVQAIPCGFVDRDSLLVLGAGAVINPRVLEREIQHLESRGWDIRGRLYIDHNATVLTERNELDEGHTKGEIHQRIGSTGEGVGAARMSRLARKTDERVLVSQRSEEFQGMIICDTAPMINLKHADVLLEGTQGSGLSLTHGPWPYCTSADTNASQICADCGVSPLAVDEVVLVARTLPIRVAGNSGPLLGQMAWSQLSQRLGKDVEERTTVTKKVRRIGEWDDNLFARAVMLNRPTSVAITFLDYLNPKDEFVQSRDMLSTESLGFIANLERDFDVKVEVAGTGVHSRLGWTHVEF